MKMNGRYLLDTNIIIALFAEDKKIIEQVNQALEVFLPATVVGELYYGVYNSSRQKKNVKKIDNLSSALAFFDSNHA